jgi:hypothetical protein
MQKSVLREKTSSCMQNCTHHCGICDENQEIVENIIYDNPFSSRSILAEEKKEKRNPTWRMLFSFTKKGAAMFLPHLALIEVFSMAFLRSGIPILYSQGFNPGPRLEIASPLSIGIEADTEIAAIDIDTGVSCDAASFQEALNQKLPQGIRVTGALGVCIPFGEKKHSLASRLWGYAYASPSDAVDLVPFSEEKGYRLSRAQGSVYGLRRLEVLGRGLSGQAESYFTVYRELYPT